MKHTLIVIVAYTLLALASTHPLWQHLGDALPGDIGDPVLNAYILAWDAHALVVDPIHLFDANIFYPLPNTLAFSENLSGDALLALPLMLLSGEPALTYNLVFLSSFVLAGYGMYLLGLRITGSRGAAFVAGVAFAFAPYHIASLAHLQLLTVGWLPLLVLTLDATYCILRKKTSSGDMTPVRSTSYAVRSTQYAAFLIFLWMQIASTLHGALFAALSVLVFGIIHVRRFSVQRWPAAPRRKLIVPLAVFVCLLLPLVLPYLAVLDELRASRPPDVALSFSAQPTDYLAAYPNNRLFGALTEMFRARDGFSEEQTLFMGFVAPLLAIVALSGAWKRRAELLSWILLFAALALVSLLLAASGPLAQALPLASIMRVPARWSAVLTFALAGLAGIGAALILERFTRAPTGSGNEGRRAETVLVAVACLAVLLFGEGFAAPIALADVGSLRGQHAVYQYLAQLPGREAVIELPMYTGTKRESVESTRMYASVLHWRPLVNGYSGFTPERQIALAGELKDFPDDKSMAALSALGRQGVRYVIVHAGERGIPRREWNQTNRTRALESGVLKLVKTFDDNDLMELTGP